MKSVIYLLLVLAIALPIPAHNKDGDKITIAAASDLKFAMSEIVNAFKAAHPGVEIDVVYGSSGKFCTQILEGAPYDLFFSADITYPRQLAARGRAASEVRTYALGRIVLWSAVRDARKMTLNHLLDPEIRRIAIANPKHAPYGKRAEEALRAAQLWDKVQARLVYGENIAQTAQLVETHNAQVGIIALSLAVNPQLAGKGGYALIDADLHQPLEQAFVVVKRAKPNALAQRFGDFVAGSAGQSILSRYGFSQNPTR